MRKQIGTMTAAVLLFLGPAAARDDDAMTRWGDATLDKLEPFLPDASRWGFVPEVPGRPSDFKAWANDTVKLYPALLVHKNWYFGDTELFQQLDQVAKDKAALREQTNAAMEEFERAHGDEIKALETAHNAEFDAATKQAQILFQQGKYEEGKAVLANVKPFHYAPLDSLAASWDKKAKELDDRDKGLLARRRSVSFRIYTNRTATATAYAYPTKAIGELGGRTLYRQVRGSDPWVNLAVYLGPANFQNPHAKLEERQAKVKCIVVWAWILSRPETLEADEAAAKKVLAAIDYEGLSKLIQP